MKAIWVFENNREAFCFNELELLAAMCSILTWKKYHPSHVTYLYCDQYMYEYFSQLNILDFWDVVDTKILSAKDTINRTFFWAASKIKVLKEIQAPYIIMDLDFYFLNDCLKESSFEYDALYSYVESGYNYYLLPDDTTFIDANINFPKFNWNYDACNVSLLYIKDDEIAKQYTNFAWDSMLKLSNVKINITGGHMVFCEQKLLYQYLSTHKLNHMPLIKERFNCRRDYFIENSGEIGLWKYSDVGNVFQHLGINKYRYTTDTNEYLKEKDIIFDAMLKQYPEKMIKVYQAVIENRKRFKQ